MNYIVTAGCFVVAGFMISKACGNMKKRRKEILEWTIKYATVDESVEYKIDENVIDELTRIAFLMGLMNTEITESLYKEIYAEYVYSKLRQAEEL
uniref:Uncharacterized protein n=1 Tax=viral metagenome TaxID=1070528 RepID=A0A6C0ECS8_9ZZZZ